MKKLFDSNENIVAYTDGASIGNPGESGVGIAFFSQEFQDVIEADDSLDLLRYLDDNILEEEIDLSETIPKRKERLTFLCSAQLYIGPATNNYTEYIGLLLAQIMFALN